jgi:hypothetical protein
MPGPPQESKGSVNISLSNADTHTGGLLSIDSSREFHLVSSIRSNRADTASTLTSGLVKFTALDSLYRAKEIHN